MLKHAITEAVHSFREYCRPFVEWQISASGYTANAEGITDLLLCSLGCFGNNESAIIQLSRIRISILYTALHFEMECISSLHYFYYLYSIDLLSSIKVQIARPSAPPLRTLSSQHLHFEHFTYPRHREHPCCKIDRREHSSYKICDIAVLLDNFSITVSSDATPSMCSRTTQKSL